MAISQDQLNQYGIQVIKTPPSGTGFAYKYKSNYVQGSNGQWYDPADMQATYQVLAPSNNAIGQGGPGQLHNITEAQLRAEGYDPNQAIDINSLPKIQTGNVQQNGLYGMAGGAAIGATGGPTSLQDLFNRYAQGTATKNAQEANLAASNAALGANAYQGGSVSQAEQAQGAANAQATKQGTNPYVAAPTPEQLRQGTLNDARNKLLASQTKVNNLSSSFSPSTSVANSSLAQGEVSQNPPALNSTSNLANSNALASGMVSNNPTQDLYQAKLQEIQKQQADFQNKTQSGISGLFANKPEPLSFDQIQSQVFQSMGLPADFTKEQFDKLTTNVSEIESLQTQLNDLDKQEQLAKTNIEGQAIPMPSINNQQMQIERNFAIKKASVAADMNAKMAYGQALKGNFDMVNQLVDKAVSYATHQQEQEISDYKWMYETYQDQWKDLSDKEQSAYDDLINNMESTYKADQASLKDKANLYLNSGVVIPDMNTLKNQTYEQAATYVSQHQVPKSSASTAPSADLSAVPGWVQAIKNGTAKITDVPKELKNSVITSLGAQGNAGTSAILDTTKQSLQELLDMVNKNQGFTTSVGLPSILGISKIPGTQAANFTAKLKQAVQDVVLPNLTLLHGLGRVTDREFQSLQSAVTSLSTNLSQSEFKKELNNLINKVNGISGTSTISTSPQLQSLRTKYGY